MKKLILPIIFLLFLVSFASAGFEIELDGEGILANETIQNTQTITHNFKITDGNLSSGYTCYLYTTEDGTSGPGTFTNVQTESAVANNTAYNFSDRANVAETSGASYTWAVNCTSSEGEHNWSSLSGSFENYTYGVDVTAPSVTINDISDEGWKNNNNTFINLTVVDDNAATCVLNTDINVSTDAVGEFTIGTYTDTFDTKSYTNDTSFYFDRINGTGDCNFTDTAVGYKWEYFCNDTAGNEVTIGANYTFYVDTLLPTAFTFTLADWLTDNNLAIINASTALDYTPAIGWGTTTEANFSRYEIFFYQDNTSGKTAIELNISARTTNTTNMSTLLGDNDYWINISAFDLAGNKRQMTTIGYKYSTDSTNRLLDAGWNIVGNVGNNVTLEYLLNWTGATTVSIWNATHEFQSHVAGGSYATTVVENGQPFLIYVATATTFSDMIWNATAVGLTDTLTNQSTSKYNLIMNRNSSDSFRFNQLDNLTNDCPDYANCVFSNVTYMSYFDNTASDGSKYTPYVGNWTINNDTSPSFGECIWAYIGDDDVDDITINWGALGGY